jgi:hypothetical protein
MKTKLLMPFILISLSFVCGCSTRVQHRYLAFEQQEQADLVLDAIDVDKLRIEKPAIAGTNKISEPFSRERLREWIPSSSIKRECVVVVLNKKFNPNGMSQDQGMDEIQTFLQDLKFKRIIFQLAWSGDAPDGLPILRDWPSNAR